MELCNTNPRSFVEKEVDSLQARVVDRLLEHQIRRNRLIEEHYHGNQRADQEKRSARIQFRALVRRGGTFIFFLIHAQDSILLLGFMYNATHRLACF
jgi:hypothetical protein